jgi:hypothetical protein
VTTLAPIFQEGRLIKYLEVVQLCFLIQVVTAIDLAWLGRRTHLCSDSIHLKKVLFV